MKDSSSSNSNTPDNNSNPFVAFRRFADGQMASFLSSLLDIPCHLVNSASRGFKDLAEYKDLAAIKRLSDEEVLKVYRDNMNREWDEDNLARIREYFSTLSSKVKTSADAEMKKVYFEHKNKEWDEERLERAQEYVAALFKEETSEPTEELSRKPDSSPGYPPGYFPLHSSEDDDTPLTSDYAKTFAFLVCNPYSPILLERRKQVGEPQWMDAFHDLLDTAEEMEMPTKTAMEDINWPPMWPEGITSRLSSQWHRTRMEEEGEEEEDDDDDELPQGILSLLSPFKNLMDDNETAESEEQEPETELDLYTRIFGQSEADPKSVSPTSMKSTKSTTMTMSNNVNPDADSSKRPSVLSMLTTTVRTTDPDGTVHTKVVLKKRFADGTEESTESVHTTPGETGDFQQSRVGEEMKKKTEGGHSWFWKR